MGYICLRQSDTRLVTACQLPFPHYDKIPDILEGKLKFESWRSWAGSGGQKAATSLKGRPVWEEVGVVLEGVGVGFSVSTGGGGAGS